MSSELIGLLLDFVVLVFLGATIFYVIRLTKNLSDFKAHRREFDGVIADLLSSIDQAERSVNTLKQVSAQKGGELDDLITQAKAMADELKIINQAGESLAARLEKLAEKNAEMVKSSNSFGGVRGGISSVSSVSRRRYGSDDPEEDKIVSHVETQKSASDYKSTLKKVDNDQLKRDSDFPSFMIQDREFGDEGNIDSLNNDEDDIMPDELQSQAERELLAALRSNKSNISKGRR